MKHADKGSVNYVTSNTVKKRSAALQLLHEGETKMVAIPLLLYLFIAKATTWFT